MEGTSRSDCTTHSRLFPSLPGCRVCVCVPRDNFHHAQTARFNIPTFLPCRRTISAMSMRALQRPLAH